VVDSFAGGDAEPISDEVRQQLLDPFVTAAQVTLGEMVATEVAVRTAYRTRHPRPLGDLAAVLPVTSPTVAALILHFPGPTATALAARVLAEAGTEPDEAMIRDCLGEVANVIAGQAKALLLGTPHHFTLSTPRVLPAASREASAFPNAEYLVAVLDGTVGEFALMICMKSCGLG
jgi:chemotaxis protein CheX